MLFDLAFFRVCNFDSENFHLPQPKAPGLAAMGPIFSSNPEAMI